ncbi:MAG: bifunctional transaldolase/phosoglucose isomerase [Firmicutes bacterium]|nr:bifunctional transaldolase/phosoglucose isomerase [Bacillota bacterium]
MNRLQAIRELGQSLWYDNIRRGIINSGELAELINQGITGVTSNPTIFERAIDGSNDYDQAIRQLAPTLDDVEALYDALVLEDIGRGADLLKPVYEATNGRDGYISIEVPPTLADDTESTVREAHRLFHALSRPNVMIKVPATPAGIPAIRQLISDGINVNVTLIFSLEVYRQVIDAYLSGLENRSERGESLNTVASVASFFVSRVDTMVDRIIEERGLNPELKGKAAIANAKLAYQLFVEQFGTPRFLRLKEKGARVQRPLWASTSTKNPAYPDLLYVEALIGPDTVDTLPPATVQAILDHGKAARTVDQGVDEAKAHLQQLEALGISMETVTRDLLKEGVDSFYHSFVTLKESLERKSQAFRVAAGDFLITSHVSVVEQAVEHLRTLNAVQRLWARDPSLWSQDPQHQQIIRNALGWLDVAHRVLDDLPRLQEFVRDVKQAGFTHAVVLGMGGSSLVSDVLLHSFGDAEGLTLHVLDTTNPTAINELRAALPMAETLFIVASKSGTTTEPNAFYHYFWHEVERLGRDPGPQFVAITDPGTLMAREAEAHHFRAIFLNPQDIGGRYSALSWFGMVPAILRGIDIQRFLTNARAMQTQCTTTEIEDNPGAYLGAVLGALARHGRDKVTFLMDESVSHLGDWLEQLLAESTGKLGTGLIPVAHEPPLGIGQYSHDRVFIVYETPERKNPLATVLAASHPVIRYQIASPYQLSQEFYRWEIATAIAGVLLEIDAFDQPNVQESKDNTKALLDHLVDGQLPPESLKTWSHGAWTASPSILTDAHVVEEALARLLQQRTAQSYIALMCYMAQDPALDGALQRLRKALTERTGCPTTLGYGPRFLHSTGQLHKGGPATGLFIQLVANSGPDLPVPGDGYDFMTLMSAQALGDFQSLNGHGRPVLRLLVPERAVDAVEALTAMVLS